MYTFLGIALFALAFVVSGGVAASGPGQVKVPIIYKSFKPACPGGYGGDHKQIGTLRATREKGVATFSGQLHGAVPGKYVANLWDADCNFLLKIDSFKVDGSGDGNFASRLSLSFGQGFFLDLYNQDKDIHNSTSSFNLGSSGSPPGAPGADLGVTKTVSNPTPNVNDTVTFTVTVTNAGPITGTNVTVTDVLPAGLTFVSATPSQGTFTPGTGVWALGTVLTGTPQTLQIAAKVSSPDPRTNTASISGADQVDPNTANNSASATEAPQQADLGVTKTVSDSTPAVGDTVAFTVTLSNNGPDVATNVTVQDTLPAGFSYVSSSVSQGGYNQGTGVWTVGTVTSGAQATLTIMAKVAAPAPPANTASISGADQVDPVTANNSASAIIQPAPGITIVKFVNGEDANTAPGVAVSAGSTLTFTYVVTNTGAVPLANMAVSDDKLGPITPFTGDSNSNGLLDLTETWTFTATAVALVGQQTNLATVTAQDVNDPPGTMVTDDDPANYFGSAIHIVKFVNGQDADTGPGPHVAVGSTVTFTYVVTNTGAVPLANVAVSDDKLGPIISFTGDSNSNGLLDPTETWTYTATATASAGQQTNTATATGQSPTLQVFTGDNPANYFGDAPGIQIVKFVNGEDANTAPGAAVSTGSALTFTYVVTNTGNVPLANVAVSDDKLGTITPFTGDTNGNGLLDTTETWTYTATATALAGLQTNVGTATANDADNPPGTTVTDDNPANYTAT